jgi:general secretion pathway protein D
MKKINNFLIASFIISMHSSMSCVDLEINEDEFAAALLAQEHARESIAAMNQIPVEYKQDDENVTIQNFDDNSDAKTLVKNSALEIKSTPSDFVKYDDQQKLKAIESVALQQPQGDVIDSVAFNFEDIDLLNVAEYMERVHKVKFVTDDILDTNKSAQKLAGNKVSFRTNAPLSKQESWSLFITFLSMAGLDVIPMSQPGFYRIVPLPNAPQEAIPAYIGSSPSLLPDNDMVVRYIYFMQNADPLKIQPLISKFQGSTGSLMVYKDLKALIFTDKSYNIKSLMTIVKELDKPVMPQTMSVVKLKRANVEDVINLYNSLKSSSSQQQQRAWAPDSKDPATEFFSQAISLTGDKRTNTLIILGPKDAVARLEDFIAKHIDIDANTPKIPVFVYYLEYTNAVDMQKTVSQLVTYGSATSAGQYGGVRDGQKYLQPMTIVADAHSNSLIINGTADDYAAVEKLIKQLDVPQKQVALEVLIIQVTGTKTKAFGSQISGPNSDNTFLSSVSAQTSGIPVASGVQTTGGGDGLAQSLKTGLSNLLISPFVNQPGSTLLTFGAPIWAVLKVLKTIVTTKILQNPFIVVSNNCKGLIKIGTSRRVITGEAIGTSSATGYQTSEANLSVTIVPQINDQKIINLVIAIDNNQFVNSGEHDAVQNQKTITTMASVADGEVLVLGGIMGDGNSSSTSGVPLLSKIPIFGWLFKSKQSVDSKNMFVVFICPKILDNINSQADVQEYTRNKIEETQDYLRLMDEAEAIDSGQDPIDKAFFGDNASKSDDITVKRLLDRREIVSHHERAKKETTAEGKPRTSKYHKKTSQALEQASEQKKSDKSKKNTATKNAKVGSIDMSEQSIKSQYPSLSSIKNMVQLSSGGATL